MAKIEVQILDYEMGVIGTLDITDSQDFPLALTYLISDGRDLESRFGDFSKSFDLPATKNNNTLFRNIYNEKIVDDRDMTGLKDCRILVDSIDFFKGKIQIKGSKQSSKPLSYSCTIFGGNYGWLSEIKDKNVCDIFDKWGELLVNGIFAGNMDGWTFIGGGPTSTTNFLAYSDSQIVINTPNAYKKIDQDITDIDNRLVVGDKYEVSFEITSYSGGKLQGRVTNGSGDASIFGTGSTEANAVGVWSFIFEFGDWSSSATTLNRFYVESGTGGFVGSVDNISLKSVKTIEYTKDNIINSWTDTQATNDIVYPLIDYGKWDGFGPYNNSYGTWIGDTNMAGQVEGKDMRPSFYLYNMLQNVFNNVGYNISSNFIEDYRFKKLICHFPPELDKIKSRANEVMISREYWNGDTPTPVGSNIKGIWDSTISSKDYQILSASNANSISSSSWTNTGWMTIKNDKTVSDINGDYDSSTGYWTAPVGGEYDFSSVAELIIGNFENDQVSKAFVDCILNVKMRIRTWSASTGISATLAETTFDNGKVGGYDYNNYIGTERASSGSAGYTGDVIPMLNAVRLGLDATAVVNTGDKVYIQVSATAKAGKGASNVRWGVAALNDNFQTSLGTSYSQPFHGIIFNPPLAFTFYNDSDNNVNMWDKYETPYFKITPITTDYEWGEIYKYSDILPCNISQVDLIKGVAHLFNLQFKTDSSVNTVYIETFNEFYKDESLAYDWTNKLDLSKEIEDKYEINLKERLSFQYKDDSSDGLMKYINESFKEGGKEHNFFNYYEELGASYPKGMTSFINPVFASTWCDWDPSVCPNGFEGPLVPAINKEESLYGSGLTHVMPWDIARPEKLFKYLPRILLYDGYTKNPNHTNMNTFWRYWIGLTSGTPTAGGDTQKTPRATFVDWEQGTSDAFANLSFNDEIINPPTLGVSYPSYGLYTKYWASMIEQLKRNPRIRVMHINLSTSDIIDLDLSKLVYINGTYWRINKIIDYAPLKNITTKVEFIQWQRLEPASPSGLIGPTKTQSNTFKP